MVGEGEREQLGFLAKTDIVVCLAVFLFHDGPYSVSHDLSLRTRSLCSAIQLLSAAVLEIRQVSDH